MATYVEKYIGIDAGVVWCFGVNAALLP